jgi:hypothetical protein
MLKYRSHPNYMDKYTVTTTAGDRFYGGESCLLAYLIFRRFGGDHELAHKKWCGLLENNCDLADFNQLVSYGATEHGAFNVTYRECA